MAMVVVVLCKGSVGFCENAAKSGNGTKRKPGTAASEEEESYALMHQRCVLILAGHTNSDIQHDGIVTQIVTYNMMVLSHK